jgi:hypothetical protein
MQARMKFPPGSEEWRDANDKLEKVSHEKRKRAPDERHRQCMSALYVEPVSGGSWNRPARTITQEFSQDFVCDAVNDCSLQYFQCYITNNGLTAPNFRPLTGRIYPPRSARRSVLTWTPTTASTPALRRRHPGFHPFPDQFALELRQ